MLIKFWSIIKFLLFGLWSLINVIVCILFAWMWRRFGIWQCYVYMAGCVWLFGIKIKKQGNVSKHRPLLIVSNHISIFEIFVFPTIFKNAFFIKGEIKKWFPLNLAMASAGNYFIDRRATHAKEAIEIINRQMKKSKYPFAIFPEGTTSNGSYVLPFKSAMFNFIEMGIPAKIQPVAIAYRDKYGKKILGFK